MKLLPAHLERNDKISVLRSLHEGVTYVFATLPIRDLLLLMGLIGFMGMPYMTLMPVFAGDVLRGGPDTLGALMGAAGVGALAGALLLARRGHIRGLGRLIVGTTAAFGVGLMTFSASRHLWLSLVILLGVGFSWMVLVAASNTLLQAFAVDEMRGRVMSLFSMMLVGMAPLGSLLAGSLAALVGAPMTVAINGFFCLVAGLVLGLRLPRLRETAIPILVARGVIADPITEG
jgi:MFS family permease